MIQRPPLPCSSPRRSRTSVAAYPTKICASSGSGYTDAQIVEIVVHIALSVLTNYANVVAHTEIDFPVVHTRQGLKDGTRMLLDL